MKKAPESKDTQQGTAFVSALLIVTLMASLAVTLIDQSMYSLLRTSHMDQRDQAYWYAYGARDFSESVLLRSGDPARPAMRPSEPWVAGPRIFPIDNGQMSGHIRDGNNCFNLNAFVTSGPLDERSSLRPGLTSEETREGFTHIAEWLGIPPREIELMKAQIIDWIDPGTQPEPGGAEDQEYRRVSRPRRAANQPFVEVEELRALPVVTPEIFAAIRPWVCVRPTHRQPPFNINTMQLEQAPLLMAMTGGRLSVGDAETLLLRRPAQGYETAQEFFEEPVLARHELSSSLLQGVTVRSEWFDIEIDVELMQTRFYWSETITMSDAGQISHVTRRYGAVR